MRLVVKKHFLFRGTMYLPGEVKDWETTFKEISDGIKSGKLEPLMEDKKDAEVVETKTKDSTGKDRERTDNNKSGKAGRGKGGTEIARTDDAGVA